MRALRRWCVATSFSAESAERIIVALDGMAPDQALAFSAQVEGLRWVKVAGVVRAGGAGCGGSVA